MRPSEHEQSGAALAGGSRDKAARSILWIDDQISPEDTTVRFLLHTGVRVVCATTGAAGLGMASAGRYDGILLDLGLPDIAGLTVLANMRAVGVITPVLVVTGFADVESACSAGRLGACGYMPKPVFVDDLVIALQQLTQWKAPDSVDVYRGPPRGRLPSGRPTGPLPVEGETHATAELPDEWRAALETLLPILADRHLPLLSFVTCAAKFRQAAARRVGGSPWTFAARASDDAAAGATGVPSWDPRVTSALAMMEQEVARHRRVTEEEVAKHLAVDRAHLGRLIRTETGLAFREWRTGLLMRASVQLLLGSDERIKQVACHFLGYEHASQFDREFRQWFGLSPRELRSFARSLRLRVGAVSQRC